MVAALTGLWVVLSASIGFSQEALTTRATDGRTAWAVVRQDKTALTEVWVADPGGQPRRARTFPGRPEGIAWEGDRLVYADRGLRLPTIKGKAGEVAGEVSVTPGGRWVVGLKGEEDGPLPPPSHEEGAGLPLPLPVGEGGGRGVGEGLNPIPPMDADVARALEAMWQGLNLAMGAYNAAQSGDFKGASIAYDRAAGWFEHFPSDFKGTSVSKAVCRGYAEALKQRARADGQAMGRGVCADHLASVRDFMRAYREAHAGAYPTTLQALNAWLEGSRGPAGVLFRAPMDLDRGRLISYGFRMPQAGDPDGTPVVWSYFYAGRGVELVKAGDDFRVIDRAFGKAQVDSVFAVGMRAMDRDSLVAAIKALDEVTYLSPSWGLGYARLGVAYLKAGQADRAEAVLQRGIEADRKEAEVHNGMGLVQMQKPMALQAAIECFQEALKWNNRYAEARYHIAETRMRLKQPDARGDAEKAIAADSTYAPAYRLIGEWYEVMKDDYPNAALWYLKYLSMRPDDPEAHLRLGKVYLMARDFEGTTTLLTEYVRDHPENLNVLPILAQACLGMRRPDRAQAFFRRYIDGIRPDERALYEDICSVAYPEEVAEYEAAEREGGRDVFLGRFWAGRDPNLITPVNERLLEHYRRVTHARQNFSGGQKPWDRRGEVYIRFGEPDYRSQSGAVNLRMGLEVQRVRDWLVGEVYGGKAQALTTDTVWPVWPVGQVPWESWVYTRIGGGIEITFTDEYSTGRFDYAPLPGVSSVPLERVNQALRHLPQRVYERTAATSPDGYVPQADAPPFKFYYDMADFRGANRGASFLEVYFGIPRAAGRYFPEGDSTRLVVDCSAALLNLETGATFRATREMVFGGSGDLTREAGAFIPDVARLEVPPGRYRLEVSARDRQSGRMGTYRQDVGMTPYPDGPVRLSGLALGWQAGEGQEGDRFTRHGVRFLPLPTRMFRKGQGIYVYYEVYNLRRNAQGMTNHSVEYAIRTESGGILSKLFPNFVGKNPQVSVVQGQMGTQEAEYRYIELDLSGVTPGKGTLTVTVRDLNGGQSVARELVFTMVE